MNKTNVTKTLVCSEVQCDNTFSFSGVKGPDVQVVSENSSTTASLEVSYNIKGSSSLLQFSLATQFK